MKNLFFCSLFLFGLNLITAQEIPDRTIGLRLGSNRGFGTEISYQMKLMVHQL